MRVAVQMDPLSCLSLKTDSTVALVRCALTRGHEVFVYTPQTLSLREGSLVAQGCVALSQRGVFPWESGPEQRCSLEEFQLVLVRQDPPFDMAYLTSLYLLEMLAGDVVVVNCPVGVRRSPEKIFPLVFSHLMPPTLITSSRTEAEAFLAAHKDVVLKPLYGHGGRGVLRLLDDEINTQALLEMVLGGARPEAVVLQAYVPHVEAGDLRVILVDGEAAGALNRVPATGQLRANLRTGARAELGVLKAPDRRICEALGPELKERGLFLVGVDIIGGLLTEINVTSPTGLCEIRALGGADVAVHFWETLEARFFS